MANCTSNFKNGDNSFLNKISLSKGKIDQLIVSRNNLRERIRTFLENKNVNSPKFYRQGSYAHGTLTKPLDGDYDIDDGIYIDLSGFESEPSTRTVHNWIAEAVEGYTNTSPIDKEPCVRAIFKAGYHVDLPVYKIVSSNGSNSYNLAKKSAGWVQSDPRAMNDWFQKKVNESSYQLRRLTKYFKAWKDYQQSKSGIKMPSGLTLSILVGEEFCSDPREDVSFLETSRAIYARLSESDAIWKPYEPTENMREYLTDNQFDNFKTSLLKIVDIESKTILEDSSEKAAEEWRKILGDRFPVYRDDDENGSKAHQYEKQAIIGTTVKSAS
ncbi:CBASS cGAMP synthase [Desulfovibrio sp. TomC]|uniref:CBASS cGAMP synthase n=1 Tax=Desulfovibrio sp. TomC TaxID=1562888 RepID=UPI0012E11B84|nr:hypothetical protein [Desulfovibrio sp. TomC]